MLRELWVPTYSSEIESLVGWTLLLLLYSHSYFLNSQSSIRNHHREIARLSTLDPYLSLTFWGTGWCNPRPLEPRIRSTFAPRLSLRCALRGRLSLSSRQLLLPGSTSWDFYNGSAALHPSMRNGAFLSLVVWQHGRRALISAVASPWDPRRKLKSLTSIVTDS